MVTIAGLNLALFSLPIVMAQGDQGHPLLQIDGYAVFYMGLVLIGALATCTFGRSWLKGYPDNREEFYLLLLIATAGGLVLAGSRHLASLFIGIEMLTLPMFGLVGYAYRERHSLEASIKYMVLSAAATAFLVFGMALLYAQAGSLSFSDLGLTLATTPAHHPLLMGGLGLMLVGFAFKLSLAPFHLWTPDVYEGRRHRWPPSSPPSARSRCSACCCALPGGARRRGSHDPLAAGRHGGGLHRHR